MLANLTRRTEPAVEQRALQVTPWGDWGTQFSSAAGVNVSTDTATRLLTVYGAVSLIADTIATLPLDVYRRQGDTQVEVAKPPWLTQPNEYASIIDFITQSLWSLLLDGNAYWAYGLDGGFVTNEVTVLDPCRIGIQTVPGSLEAVYLYDGQPFAGNILHIRGIMRPGCVKGLSPIEAAMQSIGNGLAAQEFAGRFYSNGASLSGYISTEADLNPDQANQLRDQWARAHSGLENAHRPGVLDNGATWTSITITPEQAQFLETRNFQAAEIAGQMFLLDPTMLGIPLNSNSLTYANLEQRGIHMVQFTLLRWIVRLETALARLLPRPHYAKFKVAALERADLKTRFEAYRIANPTDKWMAADEMRSLEELGPMPPGLNTTPAPMATFSPDPVSANGHREVQHL